MGMENFNNTVPEPATPDESQRVEDVEKARAMAEASNEFHTEAKDLRDRAERINNPEYNSIKESLLSHADSQEKGAERAENLEGEIYDIKQENPGMTSVDAMRKIYSDANNAENKRQEDLKKVKEDLGI
jgi:hypothetical protein